MINTLRASKWMAEEAGGGVEALLKLDANDYQVLLLDCCLGDLDLTEVAETARSRHPRILICIIETTSGLPVLSHSPENHSQIVVSRLPEGVRQAEPQVPAGFEVKPLPTVVDTALASEEPLPEMIGSSPGMRQVYRLARVVAPRMTTVLLVGDTGTEKELVARAIHLLSPRASCPFVTVDCAAIPEPLIEAELFGHARGINAGPFFMRKGRIHAADGGTLFLDDVGDLPLDIQAKMLRFLQDGEVQRVGTSEVFRVDVRVIAATSVDLAERVRDKGFGEDLYHRLAVFPIEIPPLQERIEDILPLSLYILAEFCRQCRVPTMAISPAAQAILERYAWPGNARELRDVVERAFILAPYDAEILPAHLPLRLA